MDGLITESKEYNEFCAALDKAISTDSWFDRHEVKKQFIALLERANRAEREPVVDEDVDSISKAIRTLESLKWYGPDVEPPTNNMSVEILIPARWSVDGYWDAQGYSFGRTYPKAWRPESKQP